MNQEDIITLHMDIIIRKMNKNRSNISEIISIVVLFFVYITPGVIKQLKLNLDILFIFHHIVYTFRIIIEIQYLF